MRFALALSLFASAAHAAPELASYVTNDNRDVFVALYDGRAVELDGCSDAGAARALVGLGDGAPVTASDFITLTDTAELGQHPALPCAPGPLSDALWPADSALWADLQDNARYLLAAPSGDGFYAIPSACEGIKDALQIRARTQRGAAFQGFGAPEDLSVVMELSCATGGPGPDGPDAGPLQSGWALHSFEVFLSQTGAAEQIFVASAPLGDRLAYLPIRRLDGVDAGQIFLTGGSALAAAEAKLKALLGIDPEAPVDPLGFEALDGVLSGLFVDLCTTGCGSYPFDHGYLADPAFDVTLTFQDVAPGPVGLDVLGRTTTEMRYGNRALRLVQCDGLSAALGLATEPAGDWGTMILAAQDAAEAGKPAMLCPAAAGAETCTRTLTTGQPLTQAHFGAGGTCTGRRHLIVELPAATTATGPLLLAASAGYDSITLRPAEGINRAQLTVSAGASPVASPCLLSAPQTMLHVSALGQLVLEDITLRRGIGAEGLRTIALHSDQTQIVADGLTIDIPEDTGLAPETALSVCGGALYARSLTASAESLVLQASGAQVALTGTAAAPVHLSTQGFGLSATAQTKLRLARTQIDARIGMNLRGADARGGRVTMTNSSTSGALNAALLLQGPSTVQLTQSAASGFSAVGSFWQPGSDVWFLLPANDLAAENGAVSRGAGTVNILE